MKRNLIYSALTLVAVIAFGTSAAVAYGAQDEAAPTPLETTTTVVPTTTTVAELSEPETTAETKPLILTEALSQVQITGTSCGQVDVTGYPLNLRVVNGVSCEEAKDIYPRIDAALFPEDYSQPKALYDNWVCVGARITEAYTQACVQLDPGEYDPNGVDSNIEVGAERVQSAAKSFIFTDY